MQEDLLSKLAGRNTVVKIASIEIQSKDHSHLGDVQFVYLM